MASLESGGGAEGKGELDVYQPHCSLSHHELVGVVCSQDSRVVSVVLPNAQHDDAWNVLSPTCSAARRGAVRLGRSFC